MSKAKIQEIKNEIVQCAVAYRKKADQFRLLPHPQLEDEINNLDEAVKKYEKELAKVLIES